MTNDGYNLVIITIISHRPSGPLTQYIRNQEYFISLTIENALSKIFERKYEIGSNLRSFINFVTVK